MNVKIKKLHKDAIVPTYGTEGSACFDLYSTEDVVLREFDKRTVKTGLAFEVPRDHVMLVFSRSGQGLSNGIRLSNCVGVIDSDYRGEVVVSLTKDSQYSYMVSKGDRIAQAMIIPVQQVVFSVVDELSDTARGTNGFGSTGA